MIVIQPKVGRATQALFVGGTVERGNWDIIVIGAGPAGCSAALMANSVGLSVLLIETKNVCSVLRFIPSLTNLFGMPLSGSEIALTVESQIKALEIEYIEKTVTQIDKIDGIWSVLLDNGDHYSTQSVILATGTRGVKLQESIWVSGAPDIDCLPLYQVHPKTLMVSPLVVVGCDRGFWTWAERYGEYCKGLDIVLLLFQNKWHLEGGSAGMPLVRFVRCSRIVIFIDSFQGLKSFMKAPQRVRNASWQVI